jgi:peroxiredoxin
MNKRSFNIYLIIISCIFYTCRPKTTHQLSDGIWLGKLKNDHGAEIPFNFEIKDSLGKKMIIIKNAEDQLIVDEIKILKDSIQIILPFFDAELMVAVYADSLVGKWKKHYADYTLETPFKAHKNIKDRFNEVVADSSKVFDGTWASTFIKQPNNDTSFAIGEFRTVGNKIFGTFLSSSGDYRFLEGVSSNNKIYLSTFDGSNALRFEAELSNDKKSLINGVFYSSKSSIYKWTAQSQPNAELPDADNLTFLKDGYDSIDFTFKDLKGKSVSIQDEKYKNKVVLIQIMGSWCPNCIDESSFITEYYNKNDKSKLEVIGLCYERSEDFEKASSNVIKMRDRLKIPYDLLIAGTNAKGKVNESLPMLNNFIAFPTMIILDKNHKVRKIHTGYSGPATGKHYVDFKYEFENFVNKLLNE